MNTPLPNNLLQARLRRGWTLEALARETGDALTKQAISKYEKGLAFPTAVSLRALCRALGVPPSELLEESGLQFQILGYRKVARMPVGEKRRIEAEVARQAASRFKLARAVGALGPEWRQPLRRVTSAEEGEAAAQSLREEWLLGRDAIGDLMAICEQSGVEVFEITAGEEFSGISAWANQRRPVIVIQRRAKDGARQRMDLAHEIGHLLVAEDSMPDIEPFVRRFAGAFLLPRETVVEELGANRTSFTWAELQSLKLRYGVSMQAWVRRAFDLGIITERHYRRICIAFNKARKRKDEGEPYVRPERNDRPVRLASRAVAEGFMPKAEALKLAGISEKDLDGLVPESKASPADERKASSMSRSERRQAVQEAAERSAAYYEKHPEEVLPDVVDDSD